MKSLAQATRTVAPRNGLLSVLDIACTSAGAMVLTIIAGRSLSVEQFGSLGIFLIFVGAIQTVVQGGFIDVLLQKGVEAYARGYWAVEQWSIAWLALAVIGAVAVFQSGNVAIAGLCTLSVGVGVLVVRQWWVRAFLFARNRGRHSIAVSLTVFSTAMSWLIVSVIHGLFDWKWVAVSYASTYAISGLSSYVIGRRSISQLPKTGPGGIIWHWGYALESAALVAGVQLAGVLVVPSLGLSFSAGLRGATLAMGPLPLLFSAFRMLAIPYLARQSPSIRVLSHPMLIMCCAVATWSCVAYIAISRWGTELMGDTAGAALSLMPWVGLSMLGQAVYLVAFVAGRSWVLDADVRLGRTVQLFGTASGTALSIGTHTGAHFFLGAIVGNVLAAMLLLRRFAGPVPGPGWRY